MPLVPLPLRLAAASLLGFAALLPITQATAASSASAADNAARVRTAFDAWRDGHGSVFDLLADDVEWTVAGSSPVSGVYRSRQDFMERAVKPIQARLATPIVPEVTHLLAQGDAVVVIWNGTAAMRDGGTYSNRYAWYLELEEGRIVRAVAFLDTWALDALMR